MLRAVAARTTLADMLLRDDAMWFNIFSDAGADEWLAALIAASVLLALWLLYSLRVRQIKARVYGRLQERLTERERIARELHDTLLQNMQGVILKFQGVADALPDTSPARQQMDHTLDRADEVLIEGRDRVKHLRESEISSLGLPHALNTASAELLKEAPIEFSLAVDGMVRSLHPVVAEEVFRIAREALRNAFTHSQASRIEAELVYAARELSVRIRDNGQGIDAAILEAGGKPGHWGMFGMNERAQEIRAKLNVWSGTGKGTEIELRVPGSVAYSSGRVQRWWWPWSTSFEEQS